MLAARSDSNGSSAPAYPGEQILVSYTMSCNLLITYFILYSFSLSSYIFLKLGVK
jgi:hypothetical protein